MEKPGRIISAVDEILYLEGNQEETILVMPTIYCSETPQQGLSAPSRLG